MKSRWGKLSSAVICMLLFLQMLLPMSVFAGENNGLRTNAAAITSNTLIENTLNSRTGKDWYEFTAPADGSPVELYTSFQGSNYGYMYVYLYDKSTYSSDYNYLTSIYVYSTSITDLTSYLKAGKSYYLKFEGTAGDSYSFYLSAPPYDSSKANAFRGTATAIAYNKDITGTFSEMTKQAWYELTAPADSNAIVEMIAQYGGYYGSMYVYLYDAAKYDGNSYSYIQSYYVYGSQPQTIDLTKNLRPGKKYYLKLEDWGGGGNEYSLYISGPAGSVPGDTKTLTKMSLSPDAQSLEIGGNVSLKAYAVYSDGSQEDVTTSSETMWKSSDENVAFVGSNGKVVALGEGTAVISATYKGQTGTATIHVGAKPAEADLVTIVADRPNIIIDKGKTTTIKLTGFYSDGTEKDVTSLADWSSADETIATVIKGKIIGNKDGSTTVTAELEGKSAEIKVQVGNDAGSERVLESIEASETDILLAPGETIDLTVIAVYSNGDEEDITKDKNTKYRSSKTSVVSVKSGKVKAGKKTGTATITITYNKKTITIPVTVSKTTVEALEASTENLSLSVGETEQVELTAEFSDGSIKDVTDIAVWKTDDSTVATVKNGQIKAVGPGLAEITAKYGGQEVAITVDVSDDSVEVERLVADETDVTVLLNEELELKVFAVFSDGNREEVTEDVVWQSRNSSIVRVDDSVLLAAGVGETTITGTYQGEEVTINVEVIAEKKVKSLSVDKKRITLAPGKEVQVKLTATYEDGTKEDVTDHENTTWSSKRNNIADVNESGLITGIAKGTTTITAKYGGKTATITVIVTE